MPRVAPTAMVPGMPPFVAHVTLPLLLLAPTASPARDAPDPHPDTAAEPTAAEPTAAEVGRFVAGSVRPALDEHRVPGAVVSVVHDGEIVGSEGIGHADLDGGVRMDPARSLVRIASVTKLFTWTAVMQLVERGEVRLDTDLSAHLPPGLLPDQDGTPVTLGHLMAHTAGFEERAIGIGAHRAADVAPLPAHLAADLPARTRPPGRAAAYSNHGAALAGLVVEEVTGRTWQEHVQQEILEPLHMARTTTREPLPAHLADDLATSYDWTGTAQERQPFVFDRLPPGGAMSATADDMGRFMLAHLGHGPAVLRPATRALMHSRSFSLDPRVDGWAHGFKERTLRGHRALVHDGSWQGFQSVLVLVPGGDLGLFVSTNGTGGVEAIPDVVDAFAERFLPEALRPVGDPPAGADAVDPADFEGFYQPTRHNRSSMERVLTLVSSSRLAIDGTGATFRGRRWVERGPLLYEDPGSGDRMALVAGPDGERHVATDTTTFEAVPRSDTPPVNLAVVAAAVAPLPGAMGWPVAAAVRRRRGRRCPSPWRGARWAALGTLLGATGFVVLLAVLLTGDTSAYVYGTPPSARVLLALPVAFSLGWGAAVALTVRAWRVAPGATARAHQVCLLAAVAALAWFALHWNLVPWRA